MTKLRLIFFILLGIVIYVQLALFYGRMVDRSKTADDEASVHATQSLTETSHGTEPAKVIKPRSRLEDVQKQLATREEELAKVLDELAVRSRLLDEAQQGVAARNSQLDEYRVRLEQNQGEINKLVDEKTALKEMITQQEGLLLEQQNQQKEANESQTLISQQQQQLSLNAKTIDELKGQLNEIDSRRSSRKQERDVAVQELQALQQYQQKQQQQLLNEQQEKSQLQARIQVLENAALEREKEVKQIVEAGKKELWLTEKTSAQEIANLSKAKTDLEKALQEKSSEYEAKASEYDNALLIINSLRGQVDAHPQEMATIQDLLDKSTKDLTVKDGEVAQLNEQLSQVQKDLEQVRKEAGAAQEKVKTLEPYAVQVEALQKQLTEVQTSYKAEQVKAEEAGKKVLELEPYAGKAENLQQELTAAQQQVQGLDQKASSQEAELGKLQQELAAQKQAAASFNDEKIGLSSEIAALKDMNKKSHAAQALLGEKENALDKLQAQLTQLQPLQGQVDELNKNLDEKEKTLKVQQDALGALEKLKQEVESLKKAAEEAKLKSGEQEKIIVDLTASKKELEDRLAAMPDVVALQQKTKDLDATVSEQTAQLTKAQGEKEKADADVTHLQKKVEELTAAQQTFTGREGELQKVQEELAALKQASESLTSELEFYKTKADASEQQLAAMQKDKGNLEEMLRTSQVEITRLKGEVSELTSKAAGEQGKSEEIQQAESQIQNLQADKETLQQKIEEYNTKIASLEAQVTDLQKKLEEQQSQTNEPVAAAVAVPEVTGSIAAGQKDTDKDSVPDSDDLCLNSPAGQEVNAVGCVPQAGIILEGVVFQTGSANLTSGAQAKLDQVAATLEKQGNLKVEVAGYTDSVGNADMNRQLSQQRAESVVAYLIGHGVGKDRLSARGYGQENPVASNGSAAGRLKNRRVELHLEKM